MKYPEPPIELQAEVEIPVAVAIVPLVDNLFTQKNADTAFSDMSATDPELGRAFGDAPWTQGVRSFERRIGRWTFVACPTGYMVVDHG